MSIDVEFRSDGRRELIRAAQRAGRNVNGIDEVEVSADGRTLIVTFLGRAPEGLGPGNIRIDGGRQVTGIQAETVAVEVSDDPELDDRMRVRLNQAGDTSAYRLSLVSEDPSGRPGTRPYPGFDQRYYAAEFRFWPYQTAPSDCDAPDRPEGCGCEPAPSPVASPPAPVIDYTARDYETIRRMLLDRLSVTVPSWTEGNPADLGVTVVEMLAYAADQISYEQDAVATEAYLDTARLRTSVRRHARLIDYPMHDGASARAIVVLTVEEPVILQPGGYRFAAIEPGPRHRYATVIDDRDADELPDAEFFEPLEPGPAELHPEHNVIRFWTWGDDDCVLRRGATSATLRDEWADEEHTRRALCLSPGDLLVFEEVRDPRDGAPESADPSRRQAVRLESVTPATDELVGQPVLEITWGDADALACDLRLSSVPGRSRGERCEPVTDVSVARGNAVLAGHGRSLTFGGRPPEHATVTETRRVVLERFPVTQSAPYPDREMIAAGQAARLAAIPDRVLTRLAELWHSARDHDGLSAEETAELGVLFGLEFLQRLELREYPVPVLRDLLHRAGRLLAAKRRRLDILIARARAGTVLDDHVAWEIAQTWGPAYAVGLSPEDPALHGPAGGEDAGPRAALPAVRVHDGRDTWTPRRDLLTSGPQDRHFVGELTDEGRLALRFGDGICGAAPAPGTRLEIDYRVGTGPRGNVGAESIAHLLVGRVSEDPAGEGPEPPPPVVRVRNPLPAAGGAEPESADAVRILAPLDIRRRRLRAITAEDYAALASDVPGVQRAAADIRWTGAGYEAHVAVDARHAGTPPDALLDTVARTLEKYRRIGHDLLVEPARLVPLDIALRAGVAPGRQHGPVLAELQEVLGRFFRPDALTFGEPVRVSRLVAAAASVPGVRGVVMTRLRRLSGQDDGALETGLLRIGPLEVAQCDSDPARPEAGRLVIELTEATRETGGD